MKRLNDSGRSVSLEMRTLASKRGGKKMKINKYMMIYKQIAEQIDQSILNAGDILPSENDLAEQHDTSRETVRKALNVLAQNGYIRIYPF